MSPSKLLIIFSMIFAFSLFCILLGLFGVWWVYGERNEDIIFFRVGLLFIVSGIPLSIFSAFIMENIRIQIDDVSRHGEYYAIIRANLMQAMKTVADQSAESNRKILTIMMGREFEKAEKSILEPEPAKEEKT